MKKVSLLLLVGLFLTVQTLWAKSRVLHVDSYHAGYAWSGGIIEGIQSVLKDSVELKIVRMDTKRNASTQFKKKAALRVKKVIAAWKPDVVIASDDNVSKFLISPYYKGGKLPFVFCGVNWDASGYGFPAANVTGMIEVTPIPQLIEQLQKVAKGSRIAVLGPDILTARKEVDQYRRIFNLDANVYYAKNYNDYKKGFQELQRKSDMMILLSDGGLYDDHSADFQKFVLANTRIPTGASYDFMATKAIVTFGKIAQEQGEWAAKAAMAILNGTKPSDIAIAKNEKGALIINAGIAQAAGINVPYELVEAASKIIK